LKEASDEEIIQKIKSTGEQEFFGILYDRYSDKVYGKCLSFVKNPDIARDLLHDIFLKCFIKLSDFNFKSKFSTWLYSITYNYCVDFVRKKRKEKAVDWEKFPEVADSNEERVEKELLALKAERLKRVLDEVRPEIKMMLLMKYQDNMSIKDIMDNTGLGESAIKMRLKRSKQKALEKYQEIYQDHE